MSFAGKRVQSTNMVIDPQFQLKTTIEIDRPVSVSPQTESMTNWDELVSEDSFAGEMSEKRLTKLFAISLREVNPQIKIDKIEGTTVKYSNGTAYLENVYRRICQSSSAKERKEAFLFFLQRIANEPAVENLELTLDNLVVTIKGGDFATIASEQTGETPACHELAPDLLACFAINTAEAFTHISMNRFKSLALDLPEALQLAKENITPLIPPEVYVLESALGIQFLDSGLDFSATSIISAGLMGFMKEQTPGTLLFGVPSRSELYFASAENVEAVSNLQALVLQSWRENDYPITPNLYSWDNGTIHLHSRPDQVSN